MQNFGKIFALKGLLRLLPNGRNVWTISTGDVTSSSAKVRKNLNMIYRLFEWCETDYNRVFEHIKLDIRHCLWVEREVSQKRNFTFSLCSGDAKKRTNLMVTGKQKMPRQTTIVPSTCKAEFARVQNCPDITLNWTPFFIFLPVCLYVCFSLRLLSVCLYVFLSFWLFTFL